MKQGEIREVIFDDGNLCYCGKNGHGKIKGLNIYRFYDNLVQIKPLNHLGPAQNCFLQVPLELKALREIQAAFGDIITDIERAGIPLPESLQPIDKEAVMHKVTNMFCDLDGVDSHLTILEMAMAKLSKAQLEDLTAEIQTCFPNL